MGDLYNFSDKKVGHKQEQKKVYSASKVVRQQENDKKKTIYEQYKQYSSGT